MNPIRSGGDDRLSFRRILDIPFDACIGALESWRLTGHDGELHLGKSFLRGPVERDRHSGTSRIEVRLARGPGRRPARMRLAAMLSQMTVVGIPSAMSSQAVSRAPCKNGLVSSA